MKSSKINKSAHTSPFSFLRKKSYLQNQTLPYLLVALSLIVLFTFVLSSCDAIGSIVAGASTTEYVNDNKEQDGQDQPTQTEQTSATEETAEETEPAETAEETDAIDPAEQTINVYYPNNTAEYLVGEARTVSGSGKLVDAVYELMKDPVDSSLVVLVPETTKINSIKVVNKIAKVDLSQSFMDDRFVSDTVDILLIYSIVNTLTEFKEVEAVDFYIDGVKLDIFGQLSVEDPIYRRSDLIKN
jgi:spore germination protein GerM